MTLPEGELLARLSETLRTQIAPAVGDEYTRTQAFMASVILERLSKQVSLIPEHRPAEAADMHALIQSLEPVVEGAPAAVQAAFERVRSTSAVAELGPLITALYDWGPDVAAVHDALALIRPVLRRDIDRRMEIAK
jgi:hypothetical protein